MQSSLEQPIRDLVTDLVAGKYEKIVKDGRAGRLSAEEMATAVSEYGREFIPLPAAAFDIVECYPRDGRAGEWAIDVPLWTRQEGRSDLTLTLTARDDGETVSLGIDDLHVL